MEDNIKNKTVLKLYKDLNEDNKESLLSILANEKCKTIIEEIVNYRSRLNEEEKAQLFEKLKLENNDVGSLILIVAATCTQLFVIDNFTGPTLAKDLNSIDDIYDRLKQNFESTSLSIDGSEVYHKVTNPCLLKIAQLSWNYLANFDKNGTSRRSLELEFLLWKQRYLTLHLSMCHEHPESLIKDLRKTQEFIFEHHVINDLRENKTQLTKYNTVELCCELIQSGLLREAYKFCNRIFEYASEISGISIEHTGVLGKRTKFQQNNVPQLLIQVTTKAGAEIKPTSVEKPLELPQDVELDDDTLLPDISFLKQDDGGDSPIVDGDKEVSLEGQLLMLANLNHILKAEVMEESLKDEWILAYVRAIIRSASVWGVKYKALAIRSTVEKKHTRKMDRALRQMEELIKLPDRLDEDQVERIRLKSFYSVLPLARWQMQRTLGDMSFDLCLYKNALDIYTRLEYWEGIIRCYGALNETTKAENIIRQELAKKETPYLYCLLGDATENIEHYETSWKLSEGRFARAKKSIGTHYYVRKDYEKAIENYELALSASPSNISILSMLAYSCLTIERYERAAECYRNITYHDDTSFLVWNNLSKAYIKLNQKERAWRTLREAIKCNYEEWKVWDNFMVVAMDIGALDDVITAWHRLLDLKTSHKDDKVLSALTFSLIKRSHLKTSDNNSNVETMKLLNEAIKLVARINATGGCSSRSWVCYFRLLLREFELKKSSEKDKLTKLDLDSTASKIKNSLQRATPTAITMGTDWFRSPEKVDLVL